MVIRLARHLSCLLLIAAATLSAAVPALATSSLTATFAAPSLLAASAPASTALPWISGTVATGQTLTSSLGTWTGPPTSYAYQWERDAGSGFTDIAGATSSTYALAPGDSGADIRVTVTAANGLGTAVASSPAVGPVGAALPTNGVLPAITGTAKRGQTLVAGPGTWNPAGSTYAYQWQRDSGSGFADVPGATASTYPLAVADVAARLRLVVTATNANGHATATSAPTAAVAPLLPVSTSTPTISGTAKRTFTLAATSGTWTPSGVTLAYQWQRDTGSGFADIGSATSSTYTLTAADVGAHVRVAVTATNVDGSATATSAASALVVGAIPVATNSPAVAGANRVGQTLSASTGTWSPAATSYAYQWQRDSGSGFVDLAGATTNAYVIASGDAGSRLRVRVTATNAEGSGQAVSAATGTVTAPPDFTTAPAAPTGTLMDSYVLTADPGAWTPSTATASYQWVRCPVGATAVTPSCTAVGSGGAYRLTAQDVGHPMAVRVTAAYSGGAAVAASPLTAPVDGRPLSATAPPEVGGVVEVAETAVVTPATWSVPTTTVKYQWQRCAADGTSCVDIPGATAARYAIGLTDRGRQIAVRATATSPGRTASATSAPAAVADQPLPTATVLPQVSGLTRRTATLTATSGTWASKPNKFTYQWQRCDADGTNCADIAGAHGASLLLGVADVGKAITVVVGATNTSGTVTASAPPTAPVSAVLPVLRTGPVIAGTLQAPNVVQVVGTSWETTSDTRYANQWLRCAADGTGCAAITGAVGQTYRLTPADAGFALRVTQTARNPDGSVSATSPATAPVKPPVPSVGTYPRLSISGAPAQVGRTLTLTPATWFNTTSTAAEFWRCAPRCVPVDAGGAYTYTLTDADAGALMRASEKGIGPGGTTTANVSSYFGPVQSASVATALVASGTTATLRTARGAALAVAAVSAVPRAGAVVRAASGSGTGVRALRVVVRRARGVLAPLRAWTCVTASRAAAEAQPCGAARSVRSRVTLRVAAAAGQRVRVVVVRGRAARSR